MYSKLAAIVKNTFLETIRQPIFNILLWVAVFWIAVINPSMSTFSLIIGNDIKVMKDVGLATLLLYGLLAAVFSATGVITREIESQTVLTVVSKPVSRAMFLLGKYLGVAIAILIGYFLVSITFFLAMRHGVLETASERHDVPVLVFSLSALFLSLLIAGFANFTYNWNFFATLLGWATPLLSLALFLVLIVGPKWQFQSITKDFGDMQMIYAVAMIFMAVLILTAFAIALSTRFSQVITLMLCIGILLMGLMSGYFFAPTKVEEIKFVDAKTPTTMLADGQMPAKEQIVEVRTQQPLLSKIAYSILPDFQFFWQGDLLTQEKDIPPRLVGLAGAYAALYIAAVLAMGIAMFQTREVG